MANPIVGMFRIKELRERILFTFSMLLVFRIGAVFPIPGINVRELRVHFDGLADGGGNPIIDYLDFFAGGAFSNFSVFMLGIMPYISMSIIMQLLLIVFPKLKKISQEDGGRKRIQKWQRYGTVVVCLIQSFAVTQFAQSIVRQGVDLLNISSGQTRKAPEDMENIGDYHWVCQLGLNIFKHVDIPTICVFGINTPSMADEIIKNGLCDFVAVAKGLLADPEWINKYQKGEDILPCAACKRCLFYTDGINCPVRVKD